MRILKSELRSLFTHLVTYVDITATLKVQTILVHTAAPLVDMAHANSSDVMVLLTKHWNAFAL